MTPTEIPLVDGAFIIDNSGLEKLKCPRAFQYSELARRTPCSARAGANFGSTIHKALETRYKMRGNLEVDELTTLKCRAEMLAWLTDHPQPDMDFRSYEHACKLFDVYNRIYRNEQFRIVTTPAGVPIIEASFCLPFGHITTRNGREVPVYYSGKVDLGIEDNNGLWSFDHKTAFQFGEAFDKQMAMDGGQLGYCWALGQVTGKRPCGYIIDAIRVRRPTKKDEFTGASCIDATDFKRIPHYVSDDMLDEWQRDVIALIKNIFDYSEAAMFPRHRWQCTNKFGLCDFYDVCSSPREQREMLLASGMFEANTWTKGMKQ
jgi:hypothetical protein